MAASVMTWFLLLTAARAQMGPGSIPLPLLDFINNLTQSIGTQILSASSSVGSLPPAQLSLAELFGPVAQTSFDQSSVTETRSAGAQENNSTATKVSETSTKASSNITAQSKPMLKPPPAQNDIIRQVAAFVNQGGNVLGSTVDRAGGSHNAAQSPSFTGNNQHSGQAAPPSMLPSHLGGVISSVMGPLQNQAMLTAARRLGRQIGIDQYYEMHGCVDPIQLFSGREKVLAMLAMGQGCNSFQATRICSMAQVKERIGNSIVTSRVLPPLVRSRLEGCLSAKVLFSPISGSESASQALDPFNPTSSSPLSLRECGILLSTVMDGGSLDPETMSFTRRSILPWTCNESTVGTSGVPYRVCCPGTVQEPTLPEADIVRRMINA